MAGEVVQLRKPCPFCGGQGEYDPDNACVMCDGCQSTGPCGSGCEEGSEEEVERAAWASWNKREGAPSHYRQGIEDGEDHCDICEAVIEDETGHTHAQCFEEGKRQGELDENLDCASKLSERIGCAMGYFHEVLERVPPAHRLPGELRPARAECVELAFADPTIRDLQTVTGLRLTAFVGMPADTARFTREHMMLVKLRRATVQVSIDDNGHTCVSDDGVTCGLCQRDMSPGSDYAKEAPHG